MNDVKYKTLIGIPTFMAIDNDISLDNNGNVIDYTYKNNDEYLYSWFDFEVTEISKPNQKPYYIVGFETMLSFDSEYDCINWIKHCVELVEEYMKSHNYDTTRELNMYEVFTEGINVKTNFKSIEELYAFLKFSINGFKGGGIIKKYGSR